MTISLAMVTADGSERAFPLVRQRTVLGRGIACDLRVAVPTVGTEHCEIIVGDGGTLHLNDLGSETGTYHNGRRVENAVLARDDQLKIGPVTFVVRADD